MDKPKGGRGKKAPYETTHLRVPVPIKDRVEELIDVYRAGLLGVADDLQNDAYYLADEYKKTNMLTSLEDAKEKAKSIIKEKKSASQSLAKLLTVIYGEKVVAEELRK